MTKGKILKQTPQVDCEACKACDCGCCESKCIKNTPLMGELSKNYPRAARKAVVKKTKKLLKKLNECDCGNSATRDILNHQLYIYSLGRKGYKTEKASVVGEVDPFKCRGPSIIVGKCSTRKCNTYVEPEPVVETCGCKKCGCDSAPVETCLPKPTKVVCIRQSSKVYKLVPKHQSCGCRGPLIKNCGC